MFLFFTLSVIVSFEKLCQPLVFTLQVLQKNPMVMNTGGMPAVQEYAVIKLDMKNLPDLANFCGTN